MKVFERQRVEEARVRGWKEMAEFEVGRAMRGCGGSS